MYQVKQINKLTMVAEFTNLVNWFKANANYCLNEKDIYSVRLFGKRGHYSESGDKGYLSESADRCNAYLNKLTACKESYPNAKIIVSLHKYDDIDTGNSIAYETECYGVRKSYLEVCFQNDNKYCEWIDIYAYLPIW